MCSGGFPFVGRLDFIFRARGRFSTSAELRNSPPANAKRRRRTLAQRLQTPVAVQTPTLSLHFRVHTRVLLTVSIALAVAALALLAAL